MVGNHMISKLTEGKVDLTQEHIRISYKESPYIVALVAPAAPRSFVFEFGNKFFFSKKISDTIISHVLRELKFYLVEKGEEDPWGYATYHCSTASNVYSDVHWHYFPMRPAADMRTIVLISCVSEKLDRPAQAKDLYTSTLFRLGYRYAELLNPHEISILSAKYGLVRSDRVIEPYDLTLNSMKSREIQEWSLNVVEELEKEADLHSDRFSS